MPATHFCATVALGALCLVAKAVSAQTTFAEPIQNRSGATETVVLAGELRDLQTGAALAGATAFAPAFDVGAAADSSGRYALNVPPDGAVVVRFGYLGYVTYEREVDLRADTRLDVYLEAASATDLAEVVVRARSARAATEPAHALTQREIATIPGLLGETDVLGALRLLPGVASGSESNHGLYVRGGSTDQNLVRLAGATLYNPYHLFGFFSTFNPDAVDGVRLLKGGFPAKYGGRLASVIDVSARAEDAEALTVRGGVGLLSSRLGVGGPIAKGRSSYTLSARRTYVDLVTGRINRATHGGAARGEPLPDYGFHDVNARVDLRLSPHDRLAVTAYWGRDRLAFESLFLDLGLAWGNTAASAQWRRGLSPGTEVISRLSASRYDYAVDNVTAGYVFELASGITDLTAAVDVEHAVDQRHRLGFGASAMAQRFRIADIAVADAAGGVSYSGGRRDVAAEYAAYAEDVISLGPRLTVVPGVRLSAYVNDDATYVNPEPRLRLGYVFGEGGTAELSYSRMVQYLHLAAPAGLALPIDIWYPSTRRTRPQVSDQVSAGVSYAGPSNISLGVQGFYKELRNQVEFVDGANAFASPDLEGDFAYGSGRVGGVEVKLERHRGRLRGWLGYTYQRIRRGGFPQIMGGRDFRPRHDRRHDASAVLTYGLTPRLRATATWVYGSGDLAWLPVGRAVAGDAPGAEFKGAVPVYGDRNNYRLAAYHRGDLSLAWDLRPRWGESSLTLAVYNVYDRRNAFFVYLEPEYRNVFVDGVAYRVPGGVAPKQQSLFPILPSVTWDFSFTPARRRARQVRPRE